jgi:hypothetical protein
MAEEVIGKYDLGDRNDRGDMLAVERGICH